MATDERALLTSSRRLKELNLCDDRLIRGCCDSPTLLDARTKAARWRVLPAGYKRRAMRSSELVSRLARPGQTSASDGAKLLPGLRDLRDLGDRDLSSLAPAKAIKRGNLIARDRAPSTCWPRGAPTCEKLPKLGHQTFHFSLSSASRRAQVGSWQARAAAGCSRAQFILLDNSLEMARLSARSLLAPVVNDMLSKVLLGSFMWGRRLKV